MPKGLTDLQVEQEIAKLRLDEDVKLAKKYEAVLYRRRQYLYQLRSFQKKGKALRESGFTMDNLERLLKECEDEV